MGRRVSICKFLLMLGLTGFLACNPARYACMKKVRVHGPEIINANTMAEALVKDTLRFKDSLIAYKVNPAVEQTLLSSGATVSVNAEPINKFVSKIKEAGPSLTLEREIKKAEQAKKQEQRHKPLEDLSSKTKGLLWSLVGTVMMVWLVGVLFTGAGALLHIMLGVALILIVLNLLA